jgi:hypothetical protein
MKKITSKKFDQHVKDHAGYCLKCKKVTTYDVEPDAEEYQCDVCSEETVLGIEGALLLDYIEISEESEEEEDPEDDEVEMFDISGDDDSF